jgi:hypothetical protein
MIRDAGGGRAGEFPKLLETTFAVIWELLPIERGCLTCSDPGMALKLCWTRLTEVDPIENLSLARPEKVRVYIQANEKRRGWTQGRGYYAV